MIQIQDASGMIWRTKSKSESEVEDMIGDVRYAKMFSLETGNVIYNLI